MPVTVFHRANLQSKPGAALLHRDLPPRKLSFAQLEERMRWMRCFDRLYIRPDLGSCGNQAEDIQTREVDGQP